jgi:hypothetical protein
MKTRTVRPHAERHAPPVTRADKVPTGGGAPLDAATRDAMEPRFARDFSGVRIHAGPEAGRLARRQDADAYAVGDDIVFNAGRFSPGTHAGRRLLAHELTHVVQQRAGGAAPSRAPLEQEASRLADLAATGSGPLTVEGASPPAIMRAPRRPKDDDVEDDDSEHVTRSDSKASSLRREGERREAGASPQALEQANARRAEQLERDVARPGATERSQKRKEAELKEYTDALKGSGIINADRIRRQGAFHEAQSTPKSATGVQQKWVGGVMELPGQDIPDRGGNYTKPDYTKSRPRADGSHERRHFNLKSHAVDEHDDKDVHAAAVASLTQALKNRAHLPEGEPIVLAFGRTPSKEVQEKMKAILLYEGSPVSEVRFGTTTHTLADYLKTASPEQLGVAKARATAILDKLDAKDQRKDEAKRVRELRARARTDPAAARQLGIEKAARLQERQAKTQAKHAKEKAAKDAAARDRWGRAQTKKVDAEEARQRTREKKEHDRLTREAAKESGAAGTKKAAAKTTKTTGPKTPAPAAGAAKKGQVAGAAASRAREKPTVPEPAKAPATAKRAPAERPAGTPRAPAQPAHPAPAQPAPPAAPAHQAPAQAAPAHPAPAQPAPPVPPAHQAPAQAAAAHPAPAPPAPPAAPAHQAPAQAAPAHPAPARQAPPAAPAHQAPAHPAPPAAPAHQAPAPPPHAPHQAPSPARPPSAPATRGKPAAAKPAARAAAPKGPAKGAPKASAFGPERQTPGAGVTGQRSSGLTHDANEGAGVGAGGTLGATVPVGRGVTLGPTVGAGARWNVNVKAVPGTDEVDVETTINLSESASLTVGAGGDRGGASVTGGVSGTQRAAYSHRMSGAAAKRYLEVMHANGNGGELPEHELLRIGASGNWAEAARRYAAGRGTRPLELHESEELSSSTTTEAGAGANVGGVGGSYSKSHTDEVSARVTNEDGETYAISVTINHIDAENKGVTLDVGLVGGSVGLSASVSAGQAYYFNVPLSEPGVKDRIVAAKRLSDLQHLVSTYHAYLGRSAKLEGQTKGTNIGVSIGPASATMGGTGTQQRTTEFDPEGKKTGSTVVASNTTGGSIGIGSVQIGDSETETFAGEVDEHGGAEGEQLAVGKAQQTASAFSPGKTLEAVKHAVKDPVKLKATGVGGLVKSETTKDRSLYYDQGSHDRIVGEAHDDRAWWRHVPPGTMLAPDWGRLMYALRRVSTWVDTPEGGRWSYDASAVQAAIGAFVGSDTGDRLDAVNFTVRPAGTVDGGVLAGFPGPLAGLEHDFKRYAVNDPVKNSKSVHAVENQVKAHFGAGTQPDPAAFEALVKTALDDMAAVKQHLDALHAGLKDHGGDFTQPGTHGEMMALLTRRRGDVANEVQYLYDQRASSKAAAGGKPDPAADAERQRADLAHAEAQARERFDQMWRYSASISGLLGHADALTKKERGLDFPAINRDLDSAAGQLAKWRELRTKNTEEVTRHNMGGWLNGPDPADLAAWYDKVYKAAH